MINCSGWKRLLSLFAALLVSLLAASSASAACMQGAFQNVEALRPEDRGKTFDVLVADADVEAFRQYGFEASECRADLLTSEGQAAERDAICKLTYSGNEAVQAQLARVFGVHPALLCRSAELVAGRWPGEKFDLSPDDLATNAPAINAGPSG